MIEQAQYKFIIRSNNKSLILSEDERQAFIKRWQENDKIFHQSTETGVFYSKEHNCLVSGSRSL